MKKLLKILLIIMLSIGMIFINKNDVQALPNYLTFTRTFGYPTISFNPVSFTTIEYITSGYAQISTDDGASYSGAPTSWTNYTSSTMIRLGDGGTVSFRGTNVITGYGNRFHTSAAGGLSVSGDVTSLTNNVGGDATLTNGCYSYMFALCAILSSAPNLPSTTLAENCYQYMFQSCTGISSLPNNYLPATNLANGCYQYMFQSCFYLTNIPYLPATVLPDNCYKNMFMYCTRIHQGLSETPTATLVNQLKVPSSGVTPTIGTGSTYGMFEGTSMPTTTPTLPMTYYAVNGVEPVAITAPAATITDDVKDESCEAVIGPSWHWNNAKGVCEEYVTVNTSAR